MSAPVSPAACTSATLAEVVRLGETLSDRLLDARVARRAVADDQIELLVRLARLLRSHAVALPPLLDALLRALAGLGPDAIDRAVVYHEHVVSPAFQDRFAGVDDHAYITELYSLVLGPPSDAITAGDVDWWVGTLCNGIQSRVEAAATFVGSAEFRDKRCQRLAA